MIDLTLRHFLKKFVRKTKAASRYVYQSVFSKLLTKPITFLAKMRSYYRCWRDTRIFIRLSADRHGTTHLYEFALVPRQPGEFYLCISRIDHILGTHVLAERLITESEFTKLKPLLLEI